MVDRPLARPPANLRRPALRPSCVLGSKQGLHLAHHRPANASPAPGARPGSVPALRHGALDAQRHRRAAPCRRPDLRLSAGPGSLSACRAVVETFGQIVGRHRARIRRPALPAAIADAVAGGDSSVKSQSNTVASNANSSIGAEVCRLCSSQVRNDREIRILVLEIDGQLELLRHVIRVELEGPLRLAQRTVEVAEIREREAQVVMGFGVVGGRLWVARANALRASSKICATR